MKTLVVGIGSTIRSDDGVGVHAVRAVRDWLEESGRDGHGTSSGRSFRVGGQTVDVAEIGTGGISLLDLVAGYDRLIVLDAVVSGAAPGAVMLLTGDEVARAEHLGAGHEADLPTALAVGRRLAGAGLPEEVFVVAVEAGDIVTFSEQCTPDVVRSIPEAVRVVRGLVLDRGRP